MTENDKTLGCPDCGEMEWVEVGDAPATLTGEVRLLCEGCGVMYMVPRWIVAEWELS